MDVKFVPGEVGTRDGLARSLPVNALTSGSGVTYEATYLLPNNNPLNLYYTADGWFWIQDVVNSPSTVTQLFQAQPNLYAQSVTAFSREYIAFSDGQKAQDIPRRISQDKTWQRWTQDGPAVPPHAEDALAPEIDIVSITPNLPPDPILTAVNVDGVVTITLQNSHGLQVGDQFLITGNSEFAYNGPNTVATVPSPSTITYDMVATGTPEGTGGTLVPSEVTVVLDQCIDMLPGDAVVITGACNPDYDNNIGGSSNTQVTLASTIVVKTYGLLDSHIGAFNYKNSNEPNPWINTVLPSPHTTTTLNADMGLFLNGENLLGSSPNLNGGISFFGVNNLFSWDLSRQVVNGGAVQYDGATIVFDLNFPSAGTYTFNIQSNDGWMFGMSGGVTQAGNVNINPNESYQGYNWGGNTITAQEGYPIMAANNTNQFDANTSNIINVVVPAPGPVHCEILGQASPSCP